MREKSDREIYLEGKINDLEKEAENLQNSGLILQTFLTNISSSREGIRRLYGDYLKIINNYPAGDDLKIATVEYEELSKDIDSALSKLTNKLMNIVGRREDKCHAEKREYKDELKEIRSKQIESGQY